MSKNPASKQFQCFSCFDNFKNSSRFHLHPSLKVSLCTPCFTKHGGNLWHQTNKIFTERNSDNHQLFCEICADGGTMLPCDSCSKCYCTGCLKRWFPIDHLKALLANGDDPFECFACVGSNCDRLDLPLEFSKNQKYKKFLSKTVVSHEYYRKHVFGMLNDRIIKRKVEDDKFELELENRFMQVENPDPSEQSSSQKSKSKIQSENKVQNVSKTRSVQKITNSKINNDPSRKRPRRSISQPPDLPEPRKIEIKIPNNCPNPLKTKIENRLNIDMKNQISARPKRAPKSPNEQQITNPFKIAREPKFECSKSKQSSRSKETFIRVPSFTRKDGTHIKGYEYETRRTTTPTKETKSQNSSKVTKTTKLSTSSKPTKIKKPAVDEKPILCITKFPKPTRPNKPTKIIAKRAEQIRTLSDLEQTNPKILPVVKYFAISKLQNLKESKRYQHPDLIKVNNQRFDGTMVVKKNAIGFEKHQTICKYPANLVDIRDLGTKEAINNFESLFWVYMIDGSEPNTCKKDKTGSFYYLSVLVKDAAAQMVAGGCRDCSNVEFIEHGKEIDMKAVCRIQGGQKLFNCYGRDYWSHKTDVRNPQCPVCKKCLINNE